MNSFEKAINRGLEFFGKFYGNYVGIVISNLDPWERGRIQVVVPKISNTRPLENLAIPKGLYNGKDHSLEILPSVGDNVIVEFIGGSILNPVWSFGPYLSRDEGKEIPQKPIKPGVFRFKTPQGYEILINEQTGDDPSQILQISTPKGNYIALDDVNGTYEFSMEKDGKGLDIYFDGDSNTYHLDAKGKKESSLDINGDSGVITINGGDNGGSVNVEAIRNFADAVQKDLMMVGSGSQVSAWMAEAIETLEDKNLRH